MYLYINYVYYKGFIISGVTRVGVTRGGPPPPSDATVYYSLRVVICSAELSTAGFRNVQGSGILLHRPIARER